MKLTIKKLSRENTAEIMRQARYRYMGKSGEQMSFVRALSQNPYPRFHIYLKENPSTSLPLTRLRTGRAGKHLRRVSITLHLDQKGMSYKGSTAHSGDYDGKLLKQEAERIKTFFQKT